MKLTLPSPIQKIVGLLNWKLGPEVLPKSPILLAASLLAFVVAVFLRQVMDYSVARAVASAIGSAVVLGLFAYLCARVSGYQERLTQTLCALALAGAAVIFITTFLRYLLVVSLVFADTTEDGLPYTIVLELANFLLFPLFVWNVFVFAALFRRSFRPSVPIAFAIAIPLVLLVDFWVPAAFRSL
ncbi:MAG TPA: hypothetical protein VL996_06995 [Methylocella sp.]|nr:hypothetical protein [Methylocella sp.]